MPDFADTETQEQERRVQTKERIIREMERRSGDLLKVSNPTDEDSPADFTMHGGYFHPQVPNRTKDSGYGKGCMVLPRSIAENYLEKMYVYMLFREQDKAVMDENNSRAEKGQLPMSKWDGGEQQVFIAQKGLIDTPERRRASVLTMYKGIHTEFGKNAVQPTVAQEQREVSDISKLLADIDRQAKQPEIVTISSPKEDGRNRRYTESVKENAIGGITE